jgi:hypothetical protein
VTLYVLVVLFFSPSGGLEGTTAKFPSMQACMAGQEQAVKDFAPIQIKTLCVEMKPPKTPTPPAATTKSPIV